MSIPLIDLEPWFRGTDGDRALLARRVDRHLQDVGFLVVTGHEVDLGLVAELRDAVRRFFALAPEVKARYVATGEFYAGYLPAGAEANAAAYGGSAAPDLKETFAAGPVDPPADLVAAAPRFYGPSIWPEEVPELRPLQEEFVRQATALADALLVLLAMALDAPPNTLLDKCRNPIITTSFNWYPSLRTLGTAPAADQYRIGPHTDYGTLTILDRQQGMGGLEVLVHGEWEPAPWVDGALTVNTGLCMQRWSNRRWVANEHRVLAPPDADPDEELVSLIYFHDPQHDSVIEPLPGCVDEDHPAQYAPVLAGAHLGALLDAIVVPT